MLASLTLLTLGKADASIALLSLNRNVKLLNVKSAVERNVSLPLAMFEGIKKFARGCNKFAFSIL